MTKARQVGVMKNTIFLFLSLPDNDESPLEVNIRRTAFVYSPLLKLQQRVSNQMIHVIDLLPTLVNASSLKWRTKDKIYIDGINQWQALNANDGERLDVYGDNFYISNYWKLSFSESENSGFYGSINNEEMESDKDLSGYEYDAYIKSILSSEIHFALDELSSQKISPLRTRAKVHCNLDDVGESAVKEITCSRSLPCLFDLLEDPCEFDNKHEHEFDVRRDHMKETLKRYLNGEKIDEISVKSSDAAVPSESGGAMVGIILGGTVVACIVIFIIVVCVKERCNRKRSVYYDKSKKETPETRNGNVSSSNEDPNSISVVSRH